MLPTPQTYTRPLAIVAALAGDRQPVILDNPGQLACRKRPEGLACWGLLSQQRAKHAKSATAASGQEAADTVQKRGVVQSVNQVAVGIVLPTAFDHAAAEMRCYVTTCHMLSRLRNPKDVEP